MGEAHVVVTAHKGRRLQKRTVRRRLFGKALQEIFLAELAATCNVRSAAEAASICVATAYLKRRLCPLFREAWQEALDDGYARLEAALLERALAGVERPEVAPSDRMPEIAPIDPTIALHLLREHKRGLAGATAKPGRPPRSASIEDACDHLEKKLKTLGIRIEAQRAEAPRSGRPGETRN